eukprot:s3878_g1.t1
MLLLLLLVLLLLREPEWLQHPGQPLPLLLRLRQLRRPDENVDEEEGEQDDDDEGGACCIPLPKIRGIPKGSVPLPPEEAKDLLKQLEGTWKITPLDTQPGMNLQYEEVMVRDDYYIMSGGMHNRTVRHHGHNGHHSSHQVAVANRTLKEHFHFFKGPNQEIYLDYIGSMLTKMDIAGGEVELNNGIGISMLWQRGWKKDGLPPPQQQMGGVVVAAEPVVLQATVVGASNVEGNQEHPNAARTRAGSL